MHRPYIATVAIVTIVLALLSLLSYYTYANYAREQALMRGSLAREGHAWLVALEAGTRTSVEGPSWHEAGFDRLLEEAVNADGIEFVLLVDHRGRQVLHAGVAPSPEEMGRVSLPTSYEERMAWLSKDQRWFGVARLFDPVGPAMDTLTTRDEMRQRWSRWCRMRGADMEEGELVAIIGLSTGDYLQAQEEDTRRFAGTAALLVLLALTALFAILLGHRNHVTRRALERERSYADSVVDSISNGVLSVDCGGRIVTINHVSCQLLDTSPDQAVGKHYSYLIRAGDCRLEPTISEGVRIVEKEMRCTSVAGADMHVAVSASRLTNSQGDVLGAVAVLRDVKPLRALEEQLRRADRLTSMGRMVAGVAHELRNPLSSLRGIAGYFARKYEAVPEDREYAELMMQEVDRLNRVISDLLSFSQPVASRRDDVILRATIAYALRLCETELASRHVSVEETYAAGLPELQADGDLLVQVFVNLFLNAAEAMPEGGRLRIHATAESDGVQIAIEDTGLGIEPEQRERVFDPFFTAKAGGTGLGLAIVHAIIQSHGGTIDVTSEPGKGTAFRIVLPTGNTNV